jgi:signal transduction histidine kinase
VQEGQDIHGQKVLSAYAPVAPLGWRVFVELPAEEAYASLYDSIKRSGVIIFAGLVLAFLSGLFLARRMVVPIQMLRAGAQRIGGGDLGQRISIKTGDELEGLADQFNEMANRLQDSYSGLERKVELRTRELSEALEQQTASSDILRVISGSPTDVQPVFDSIVANAVRLCGGRMGAVFESDGELVKLVAHHNCTPGVLEALNRTHPGPPQPDQASGRAILSRAVAQVEDTLADPTYLAHFGNWRSVVAVPMLRAGAPIGAIVITRKEPGPFAARHVELLKTFADQAVIAVENVRLFDEARARTDELAKSVEELQALGEVSQAVNSTLDLQTVLDTIVAKAVQLSGTDAGTIYVFDEASGEFQLRATYGMSQELIASFELHHVGLSEALAQATGQGSPVQSADLRNEPSLKQEAVPVRQLALEAGYRARMIVPLLGADRVVGALVVRRKAPGELSKRTVDLLQTFAAQSVLAIQNARLFNEIQIKGHQLEVASQHKSQFLANMSHELRTPLNAILGYTELILDSIYGDMPQEAHEVLERVQSNGKHLLGLINDVLDLSKIEAGQLTLSLDDYSIKDVVHNVFTVVEPLATEKNLALKVELPNDLPTAHGDERRLTQVLLNLVGNAVKFTDSGEVAIKAAARNGAYTLSVRDTGPGIDLVDQTKIFDEFQQADNSSTKTKGGTGLGLSIARRIVAMHGGRIWVESEVGAGSTFFLEVPIDLEQQVGNA